MQKKKKKKRDVLKRIKQKIKNKTKKLCGRVVI